MITVSCACVGDCLRYFTVQFPESQRVIYTRNPLVEVVAQLRFPRILKIEAELPVAFQERIRSSYPKLREIRSTKRLPEQVARVFGIEQSETAVTYEFTSNDERWKLALTSTFVALTTNSYTRWEEFRARLTAGMDALQQIYSVNSYARVGLRYRDLISRSEAGLGQVPWTTCLRSEVVGELAIPAFSDSISYAHRTLGMRLDFADSTVRLSHGLVEAEDDAGAVEDCYLIDADFYTEAETERHDAEGLLDRYNQESGRLFRWCITQTLHEAMGPVAP